MTAVVNGMTPRRFSDMRYKSGKFKLDMLQKDNKNKEATQIRHLPF